MIQKQTVYMKSENLDRVSDTFELVNPLDKSFVKFVSEKKLFVFTLEQLNEYIINIIKQTLETAAEKAEVVMIDNCSDHTPYWGDCVTCGRTDNLSIPTEEVDKQSIISTFEETYRLFSVD